jgi:hypothetical protein
MDSDLVILDKYLTVYNHLLMDIQIFEFEYPNNIEGYNYLIKIADKYRKYSEVMGAKCLAPLPSPKTEKSYDTNAENKLDSDDMALILRLMGNYHDSLKNAKLYGLKFPNDKDGYNFMVDLAEEQRQTCIIMGIKNLKDLPPKK